MHGFMQNNTLKLHCHLKFVVSKDLFQSQLFFCIILQLFLFRYLFVNMRSISEFSILCVTTLKTNILWEVWDFRLELVYFSVEFNILSVEDVILHFRSEKTTKSLLRSSVLYLQNLNSSSFTKVFFEWDTHAAVLIERDILKCFCWLIFRKIQFNFNFNNRMHHGSFKNISW